MSTPLESLLATGTRLWLDSIDPDLVTQFRKLGATGATSNPVIVSGLLASGRFDARLAEVMKSESSNSAVAWIMTDWLVRGAQAAFADVWQATAGNDGYVSFELDPLLEDPDDRLSHQQRVAKYIVDGQRWCSGHSNRMIKVPATPAGIDAVEELTAVDVPLNVTLIFTQRQYEAARDAIWRGAQRRQSLDRFKSVYSIFVSRIDAYTQKHIPALTVAQGHVGIVNARQIWKANQEFWTANPTPLQQQIVFASTGSKNPDDDAWKYVAALAGSDIQTNPPSTNSAVQDSGQSFSAQLDVLPTGEIRDEIDRLVDFEILESVLMEEGIAKFADPQRQLIASIAAKRADLSISR